MIPIDLEKYEALIKEAEALRQRAYVVNKEIKEIENSIGTHYKNTLNG